MLVMILEAVSPSLRGEITRWLTPISATVFVGSVSGEVRDGLWGLALARCKTGQVIQAWSARGEPGYAMRIHNFGSVQLVDLDGVPAIAVQDAAWREASARFGLLPARRVGSELTTDTLEGAVEP